MQNHVLDVKSSCRTTRPEQAEGSVGGVGLGPCLAPRCGGALNSTHQIPCSNKKLCSPHCARFPPPPLPARPFLCESSIVELRIRRKTEQRECHDASPRFPPDMPDAANRLVIATAGQRHGHADSRSEFNGPDRPIRSLSSHLPGHNSLGGSRL